MSRLLIRKFEILIKIKNGYQLGYLLKKDDISITIDINKYKLIIRTIAN